ncbi:MAG TPA: CDP-alcohol phosphatidyltransferase family protein [Firmicutes bacterium]|jgi:cardiolipin synthase|nr:CDP-alcohol phosphatidyltransferase family protein [Bacillota bacterium]
MTIANGLSILRLLLSPLIFWAFMFSRRRFILLLWLVTGLTDVLDGWVARKRGEITELGKILDPVADKLVLGFSLAGLIYRYNLPLWVGLVYLVKETAQLLGGLFIFRRQRITLPSNLWGKAGTTLFFTGFFLYLFSPEHGFYLVLTGLAVSVIAFCTYTVELFKQVKKTPHAANRS